MKNFDSIVILGPTASGKTKLAVQLAGRLNSEIISIDSRMVYKHLNIGTGKDLGDYFFNNMPIPYHLIDVCEPEDNYHIYQFQQDFKIAKNELINKGKLPILCGGSGMYLEAVIKDYTYTGIPGNPHLQCLLETFTLTELQEKFEQLPHHYFKDSADLGSKKRAIRALIILNYLIENPSFYIPESIPLCPLILGLNPSITDRKNKIINRLKQRIETGLIEEVDSLLKAGISAEKLISLGLEYKFITKYITGEIDKENMIELLQIAIQQFAKRQMTYFRKMEKSGLKIHWLTEENHAFEILKQHNLGL